MLGRARKTLFLGNDPKDSQQFDINIAGLFHAGVQDAIRLADDADGESGTVVAGAWGVTDNSGA